MDELYDSQALSKGARKEAEFYEWLIENKDFVAGLTPWQKEFVHTFFSGGVKSGRSFILKLLFEFDDRCS